ncbi:MAG: NAD(P)/FAD-dependent oxidoreductase [Bacteroidota bacterium]
MNDYRKQTRSAFLRAIRKAFVLSRESEKQGIPLTELMQQAVEKDVLMGRRTLLANAAKAGLVIGLGGMAQACQKVIDPSLNGTKNNEPALLGSNKTQPSIAIIGAGIAGLNCAYQLKKQGIYSLVYEGSPSAGGRIVTKTNLIAQGTYTECGGEFIDTGHTNMRNLATEFGLPLADTFDKSEDGYDRDSFWIDGRLYSEEEVMEAFTPYAKRIATDIQTLPNLFGFNNYNDTVLKFDQLSISDYFDSIGMPVSSFLRIGLDGAYNTEYGLETSEQTAINFLYLFTLNPGNNKYQVFGLSDERFKVIGGNQQITNTLASRLGSQVILDQKLVKISRNNNNKYLLYFENGNLVIADLVVMTLPFSVLRNVDTNDLELPAWKTNAINNLGYGTNAKLLLGFNSRVWRNYQSSGYIFTNGNTTNPTNFIQTGWDNTAMQPGTNGGFTVYAGGNQGASLSVANTNNYLSQLDTMWPGCLAAYNGMAKLIHWPNYQWTLGSYSCWKVGQVTTISGAEILPVDNLYFAGEHTSALNQGFMEGAAATGATVASKLAKLVLTNKG